MSATPHVSGWRRSGRLAHTGDPTVPLRGNLHAHSLFSDGVRSAEQVIAAYEALGYDFLAITDHDDRVPPHYWRAPAAPRPPLLLFPGVAPAHPPLSPHLGRGYG